MSRKTRPQAKTPTKTETLKNFRLFQAKINKKPPLWCADHEILLKTRTFTSKNWRVRI